MGIKLVARENIRHYGDIYVGDTFALKDIDDGSASGEYVIARMTAKLYETPSGGQIQRIEVITPEGQSTSIVNIRDVRRHRGYS